MGSVSETACCLLFRDLRPQPAAAPSPPLGCSLAPASHSRTLGSPSAGPGEPGRCPRRLSLTVLSLLCRSAAARPRVSPAQAAGTRLRVAARQDAVRTAALGAPTLGAGRTGSGPPAGGGGDAPGTLEAPAASYRPGVDAEQGSSQDRGDPRPPGLAVAGPRGRTCGWDVPGASLLVRMPGLAPLPTPAPVPSEHD